MYSGVLDHRVLGNRSRAYLAMDRLDEALQDAETACQLRPFWPKVHFIITGISRGLTTRYLGQCTIFLEISLR